MYTLDPVVQMFISASQMILITFETRLWSLLDESLNFDHSNESLWTVLSCGDVYFVIRSHTMAFAPVDEIQCWAVPLVVLSIMVKTPLWKATAGRCCKEKRSHFALSHFTFRLSTLSRAYSRLSIIFACIAARFPFCICCWRLSYIHTKQSRLTPEAYIKRANEDLSNVSFPQIILRHWSKCRFPVFQIQWLQIGTSCQVIYYLIETLKNCLDLVQWYPCKRSFSDSFTFGRDWI